ncbi:MAG: Gx transporter family protein [Oscillospiraceae bacterium]
MKRFSTKKLTLCAVLVAMALGLSYFERFIPLQLLIPIPGVKLGLANIVTMLALYFLGTGAAFIILIVRCVMSSIFGGGIAGLMFSLTGGLLAMTVMALVKNMSCISVYGVSVCGAAAHVTGQIVAAMFIMRSFAVIGYLPLLLCTSVVTGFVTGAISSSTFKALIASGQIPEFAKAHGEAEKNVGKNH